MPRDAWCGPAPDERRAATAPLGVGAPLCATRYGACRGGKMSLWGGGGLERREGCGWGKREDCGWGKREDCGCRAHRLRRTWQTRRVQRSRGQQHPPSQRTILATECHPSAPPPRFAQRLARAISSAWVLWSPGCTLPHRPSPSRRKGAQRRAHLWACGRCGPAGAYGRRAAVYDHDPFGPPTRPPPLPGLRQHFVVQGRPAWAWHDYLAPKAPEGHFCGWGPPPPPPRHHHMPQNDQCDVAIVLRCGLS